MRAAELATIVIASVLLAATSTIAATPALPRLPSIDTSAISISGLSSGADFAVQFQVAYSETIMGLGVFAGQPFHCAATRFEDEVGTVVGLRNGRISSGGAEGQTSKVKRDSRVLADTPTFVLVLARLSVALLDAVLPQYHAYLNTCRVKLCRSSTTSARRCLSATTAQRERFQSTITARRMRP